MATAVCLHVRRDRRPDGSGQARTSLRPFGLRVETFQTLLGRLAATGLRMSEAIRSTAPKSTGPTGVADS
jgi:hypothetical protein